MATSTSDVTGNSALVARGTNVASTGLIAAVVAGSIVLASGYLYTDRTTNTYAAAHYGTGAYTVYADSNNGAATTVACTNTGGLAKYTACYVPNPLSGTAAIVRVQLDTYKSPTAAKANCTTTTPGSTTATGTNVGSFLIRYTATASGTSVISGSGGSTSSYISPIIPPLAGVRCWFSATPGPGLKAQLRLWLNGQFTALN